MYVDYFVVFKGGDIRIISAFGVSVDEMVVFYRNGNHIAYASDTIYYFAPMRQRSERG